MEDLTGKQFGPYQIVAPLGEGGMAAVYKAYQPSMERYVAIKVLPRQMAESAEFIARFKREAHMLAQLQHPHILPVFDYGQADGYTYIVMPFIQSGTLADVMRTRQMSLPEIGRIITQVGDALGYAHARGMIHRDVKPSNVLIDERGNCLLTDFGLARMTDASAKLTSSGAVMGTPAYMSPEQGAGHALDGRSDIYSLGIIFYEMVTGQVPYQAETPIAIVFKHIQDPLPPVRKFVPDLPEEIELVLLKSLAKSPADRYQTAEDFVHAVELAIPAKPSSKSIPVPPRPVANETFVAVPPSRPSAPVAPASQPGYQTAPAPTYQQQTPLPTTPPSQSASRPPSRPPYNPASQPPTAKKKQAPASLWALAGIGVLAICAIGAVFLIIGARLFGGQAAQAPTETPLVVFITATNLPASATPLVQANATLPPTPAGPKHPAEMPLPPIPQGVPFARINKITLNDQNKYVVDYEVHALEPDMHVHFFFDTVPLPDAGAPGKGPWKMVFDLKSSFTDYGTANRPPDAALLCILVAHSDHHVLPGSGNCFPLPDVATATAWDNTACLDQPVETGKLMATFKAGMSARLLSFSSDKSWASIKNPDREHPSSPDCWIPVDSSLIGGDTSQVPVLP